MWNQCHLVNNNQPYQGLTSPPMADRCRPWRKVSTDVVYQAKGGPAQLVIQAGLPENCLTKRHRVGG